MKNQVIEELKKRNLPQCQSGANKRVFVAGSNWLKKEPELSELFKWYDRILNAIEKSGEKFLGWDIEETQEGLKVSFFSEPQ